MMRQNLEVKAMVFMHLSPSHIDISASSLGGKKIVVTNAFMKKTQKLPTSEKERALKAYVSYEDRIKEGSYYETEK